MLPLSERDYMRGEHPPSCSCAECTEKRLAKQKRAKRTGCSWIPFLLLVSVIAGISICISAVTG